MIAAPQMARAQLGTTVPRQHRSSLIPTPSVSQIVRLAACSRENSLLPHHRAKFHSQTLMVSINWGSQARSEERRVGKECRYGRWLDHEKEKERESNVKMVS